MDHEVAEAYEFRAYAVGFVSASVCSALSIEETAKRLNYEHPTGIGPWTLATEREFNDGTPMPCECEDYPATHKHYLFHC